MAVYGVGLGVVDASTNMQAVALEHRYDRPILPSFHGAWTLGGILGAAVTLATARRPAGGGRARGRAPAGRAVRPVPAPRPRHAPRPPARSRCRGARSCWWASRWCSSTWSTPRPRPGARRTSTTPSRRPRTWSRWRRSPTWSPACVLRLAGDRLVAGTARCAVLRVGAVVAVGRAGGRGVRADLAGGGRRVHPARRRHRRDRAAELLGRRPDRRRRRGRPGAPARPRGRGDRAVQPVQLRRRAARRRAHRASSAPATCGSASPSRWC